MKIISGKDYYDKAMAYGTDPNVVFVRHKDKRIPYVELPYWSYPTEEFALGPKTYCSIYPQHIFFCGKYYFGLHVRINQISKIVWDFESFATFIGTPKYDYINYVIGGTKKAFEQSKEKRDSHRDILVEKRITIAVSDPDYIRYYPTQKDPVWIIDSDNLKDYEFYRVIDPVTAFQEISIWVSGVIPKDPPEMVSLGNRDRIEKRGFDYKTSFRKEPRK